MHSGISRRAGAFGTEAATKYSLGMLPYEHWKSRGSIWNWVIFHRAGERGGRGHCEGPGVWGV